jgi:hypothetical protein
MSIEAGAKAGMIAPDDVTFAYLKGRPLAPKGGEWDQAGGGHGNPCAEVGVDVCSGCGQPVACLRCRSGPLRRTGVKPPGRAVPVGGVHQVMRMPKADLHGR